MKGKQSRIDKNSKKDSRLATGNILYWVNEDADLKRLFTIAGTTYNEVAVVRLIENSDIVPVLENKFYRLSYKTVRAKDMPAFPEVLYADLSTLIIKDLVAIKGFLDNHPDFLIGSINKRDIIIMLELIMNANTISKETKDKFFL